MKAPAATRLWRRFHVAAIAVAILFTMSQPAAAPSPPYVSQVPVQANTPMCDYFMNNLWVLIVAYAAVMSYRFFSGKAADFKDMWDEFQGKK
jgi:hypothetical protein